MGNLLRYTWIFLTLLLASPAFAEDFTFENFKKCFTEKSAAIPSDSERKFLQSYMTYLGSGRTALGEKALSQLVALKPKNGRLSSKWIALFEGSSDLCCVDADSICRYSLGSATFEKLMPLVKNGDPTAISIVLAYSALVNTDGAEGEELASYQIEVKNHKKAVAEFEKSYQPLLKTHPIQWKN